MFDERAETLEDGPLEPGTYLLGSSNKSGRTTYTARWICAPLHVEAVTSDTQGNSYGRLLRFRPTLGGWRTWPMPMAMLSTMDELRGALLGMGLQFNLEAKRELERYLMESSPSRSLECVRTIGWVEGRRAYALPEETIGPDAEGVVLQSGELEGEEPPTRGTLNGWREEVATRAVGNPLLMVAISAAFAGPLLKKTNAEGGGLHYIGDSSTGKTTCVRAACSVWGGRSVCRSWKTTANGLEGVAARCNDNLLALDEISECSPSDVSAIVYSLGNGIGKQRASRTGAARNVTRWLCMVISSGENSIETSLGKGGIRTQAGQAVRLLNVAAKRAHGAWDNCQGLPPARFSDALISATRAHYGHAGREFLRRLTEDPRDFCAELDRLKGGEMFAVEESAGQEKRAAARLALIGYAGELASQYGLTGWPLGAAMDAALECFDLWRAGRVGAGNGETPAILSAIAGFLERAGDSRFSDLRDDHEREVRDRAGWWKTTAETRLYLFTSEGLKDATKGFDLRRVVEALDSVGALAEKAEGKRYKKISVQGRKLNLFVVNPERLRDDL